MNPYFDVLYPDEITAPILVDVPHAGEWIPEEVASEMAPLEEVLRRDLDLYTDKLWERAPSKGAIMIASKVSRYVLDLNRAPDDVSPLTVEGGERITKPGYYRDRGVVWRNTTDGTIVMKKPLSKEAFQRRIDLFHTPYYEAVAAAIERIKARFGYCIMIDGHSMPSFGRADHQDPGARRADIVPGDVDGSACDPFITRVVEDHFERKNYEVATNQPYKGGWLTRYFGRPSENVHAIQIEVNRDLYMDENTFEMKEEGFQRLSDACVDLISVLARRAADRTFAHV